MLTALILVCSLAITPDLATCTRDNAVDVMRVPTEFGHPATCLMNGQAFLAQTEMGRTVRDTDRVKVVCTRSRLVDATQVRPLAVQQ